MRRLGRCRHRRVLLGVGALRETRTPDLLITNQMLYRLSYEGMTGNYALPGKNATTAIP